MAKYVYPAIFIPEEKGMYSIFSRTLKDAPLAEIISFYSLLAE